MSCAGRPSSACRRCSSQWLTLPEPRKSNALKNACVKQVEDRRDVAADAERQHHVAELADRRIGEHALDVGHDDARSSAAKIAVKPPMYADRVHRVRSSRGTRGTCARRGRRRQRPSSRRGSARRPASGPPSRPAARRAAAPAPTCRRRRRTCPARTGVSVVLPICRSAPSSWMQRDVEGVRLRPDQQDRR